LGAGCGWGVGRRMEKGKRKQTKLLSWGSCPLQCGKFIEGFVDSLGE